MKSHVCIQSYNLAQFIFFNKLTGELHLGSFSPRSQTLEAWKTPLPMLTSPQSLQRHVLKDNKEDESSSVSVGAPQNNPMAPWQVPQPGKGRMATMLTEPLTRAETHKSIEYHITPRTFLYSAKEWKCTY